ncbi:phosphate propanoyltransferase [Azotosporobacter soli]|uniref:phosphate propanoyltransferase n=1 Tax=Azotosporobacter soli TaxID=3055040 RepID=UPI003D160839
MEKEQIDQITRHVVAILAKLAPEGEAVKTIPVGVSNRHIHLSAEHMAILFGCGASLTHQKDLKQVGEFAAAETLTLVGPKGVLRGVRVLGPIRNITQVEISRTDGFSLGVKVPVRDSGDLEASPGIVVVGPCGAVTLKQGVICAARHIHMHDDDARNFGVSDGQRVTVETDGVRGALLKNVLVRVSPKFRLELHIDTDEANALGVGNGDEVNLRRREEG